MGPSSFDASTMGMMWAVPFMFFLLSLALGPLYLKNHWHKCEIPLVLISVVSVIGGLIVKFTLGQALEAVKITLFHHYVPFLLLMGSLYIVSSGIHITTKGSLTPLHNVMFLAVGSLLSSCIGTTGASMLLIRPFLSLNRNRPHKAYLVIFFIFFVSNIGGALTPIGDPPLFLGFLNGVEFFWPLRHLLIPACVVMAPLLLIFYGIDRKYYASRLFLTKEQGEHEEEKEHEEVEKFTLYGKHNIVLLACILISVVASSVDMERFEVWRDVSLVIISLVSYFSTSKQVYHLNRFSFGPLREVALVFLAIFITLLPIEAMLHTSSGGAFSGLVCHVNACGFPDPLRYYFVTGMLSGFLDNAPTYLLFFHMAGGNAHDLMTIHAPTLMAISMGSVFFGALSYIGNAPNLMVKAIAERSQVTMPSFGRYMMWSCGILLPILSIFGLIFFWN